MCFLFKGQSLTIIVLTLVNLLDFSRCVYNTTNRSIFSYQDINQCKRNEFYDLDNFQCVACNKDDENFQPTENKFACECVANLFTLVLYDSNHERPICGQCNQAAETTTTSATTLNAVSQDNCVPMENESGNDCNLKYVNRSSSNDLDEHQKRSTIRILSSKYANVSECDCDLLYNFQYKEYCIANELLKPYLHYNSYWQPVGNVFTGHFGDLKFVAFFCLRLRNATFCNHLANLCVMSHYSLDKNSPCSSFLLTQASDVVMRYATGMDDQFQAMGPFLYFRKGKQTLSLLSEPIKNSSSYSLSEKSGSKMQNNKFHIFSMTYGLEGTLQRRGTFRLSDVDLCGFYSFKRTMQEINFAKQFRPVECTLSLENLIDLAGLDTTQGFTSLFLNYTNDKQIGKVFMHALPILVENLTPENQRNQLADWILVKRFQLITAQPRFNFGAQKPSYEDIHKLQRYRSIRFVTKFHFHYKIHEGNHISVPLVRLRYQNIELHANASLNELYKFRLEVTFSNARKDAASPQRDILNETVLPMLLLITITLSLLRAYNYRKRRRSTVLTTVTALPQAVPAELCDFRAVLEFLLELCSNVSHALLMLFLLRVMLNAMEFLFQKEVKSTLPLNADVGSSLEILLYVALSLKFIFYCIHLWRNSHFDLFFIDWERPRSYDNNHFNLKSNLETSSVCSSVRTFTTENNVSAWRIFFTANEWIRLSGKRKTSTFVQGILILALFEFSHFERITVDDDILKIYFLIIAHVGIYFLQLIFYFLVMSRINGNPIQKFVDLCSWANVSVFVLLESSYGFYIHGRSPHGFADTDMSSMIMQLQRESQSMCGRRGLLNDSDQQTYIILPPINLRTYFQRLLIPFQHSCSISQVHYQKEATSIGIIGSGTSDGNLERTFIAYSSINRFFCAFIDHAIKDMDYIIKEKTVFERLLDCEFENYLTENKGTFYIDNTNSFSQLFLYGNEFHMFIMEFLLILAVFQLSQNLLLTILLVCVFNVLTQWIYSTWMRHNVSKKTLIDERFLM